MNLSYTKIFNRLIRETGERKLLATVLYLTVAIVFLILAVVWPKVYISTSTVFIDRHNILRPLMDGTAVTTSAVDRAKMAQEVVFSRKSMDKILSASDWFERPPSAIEKDQLIQAIKKNTDFDNFGDNLIRISFKNEDPKRAYDITKVMTALFIDESLRTKRDESREAYQFIDSQVAEYHRKLQDAETAIKNFRARNVNASPAAEADNELRLTQLQRDLEEVEMEINEEKSVLDAHEKQLSGKGGIFNAASIEREGALSSRISELNLLLENLRLTYLDNYPDIVQLKHQIANLELQILDEIALRKSGKPFSTQLRDGPIAQELRSQILSSHTALSSLLTRKKQIEKLLLVEHKTKEDITAVKAEIAELTRDYDVNKQMYQKLVGQRENANISMNIDIANQGLTIKVQESASFPVSPKGIRFAHIIVAGLILSFAIPVGVCHGLSLLDEKVRDADIISEELQLPVLASVYKITTQSEIRKNTLEMSFVSLVIISTLCLYGYLSYLRLLSS